LTEGAGGVTGPEADGAEDERVGDHGGCGGGLFGGTKGDVNNHEYKGETGDSA
jgi:hypothetical protein